MNGASMRDVRMRVPMYKHREAVIRAVRKNPVTVLVAGTGSGKSTQVPQYLLEAGFHLSPARPVSDGGVIGLIGVVQPRRIMAKELANRVACEMGTVLGGPVGYVHGAEASVSNASVIVFMSTLSLAARLASP